MAKAKAKAAVVDNSGVVAWKAPFPAPVLDEEGKDTVTVRAVPKSDLRINGTLLEAGRVVTLPCSVAHAHAAALASPKE